MKDNLLYHRVDPRFVDKLLESKVLRVNKTLDGEQAICLTRDILLYSRVRPFVIVFNRNDLLKHYKIKPCCVIDKLKTTLPDVYSRFSKHKQSGFENEERLYKDVPLSLALYYGHLPVGHYDYRKPDIKYKNFN